MVRLRDTAEKQAALSVCHVTRDTKSIQTVHRLGAVKQTSSGLGLIQYVNVRANVSLSFSLHKLFEKRQVVLAATESFLRYLHFLKCSGTIRRSKV